MKPGKTVQRSSKSALITERLISSRVDKSLLSLLMFFLVQGTLTNHRPSSHPLWKEVRLTVRWFKGIVSSIAPRLLNFIGKPNTSSHCQICLAEIYMSRSWVWLCVKDNSKSVSTKMMKYQELAGSGCTHAESRDLLFGVRLCGRHDAYAKKLSWSRGATQTSFTPKHEQVMVVTWENISSVLPDPPTGAELLLGALDVGEGGCCGGGCWDFLWHCWHSAAEQCTPPGLF